MDSIAVCITLSSFTFISALAFLLLDEFLYLRAESFTFLPVVGDRAIL